MSFLRRNDQNNDDAQAVPATLNSDPTPMPPAPASADDGGGGIIGWLQDSYNGLYKIVLEPSMPTRSSVYLLIFGILIGLLWAYVIQPISFFDANPNRLSQSNQDQWVRMVAVGFDDQTLYDSQSALALLQRVPNPSETIENLINSGNVSSSELTALQNLQAIIPAEFESAQAIVPAPPVQDFFLSVLLPVIIMAIVFPVFMLLWRLLIYPNVVAGIQEQIKVARDPEYRAQREIEKQALADRQKERALRDKLAEEAKKSDLGPPVMTQLSIFAAGRAYDESFEIELPLDQGGDFLGQSGAVIAESVDPDPVAIEVWLFDMFSSTNTSKIFITPTGNSDPGIRGRIEGDVNNPANDIVVAGSGAELTVESDKLMLKAKMAEVSFDGNGRFESFQLQIQTWQKDAAAAGGTAPPPPSPVAAPPPPAGAPPMSAYDDIQFDPPPAPPSSAPPMSAYDDIQFDPPPTPPGQNQPPSGPPAMFEMDDYEEAQPDDTSASGGRLTPPPLNFPPGFDPPGGAPPPSDDDDDDPFGGTGDFTPLPNR